MEAQLRIRQNAMEAQDYMQGLLDWQQSMKAKAGSAAGPGAAAAGASDLPAVRGRPAGVVQPAQQQQQASSSSSSKPAPAAHTYKNYAKWDSFDVGAALRDDEPGTDPTPRRGTQQQQQQQPAAAVPRPRGRVSAAPAPSSAAAAGSVKPEATSLKDQGNKLFQAGYYGEAVDCYTKSIAVQPTSVAYANRAMALLKQRQYGAAEQDCDAALLLDPGYVKALHRRGTARRQLGRSLEAAADFESALRLEPGNKAVQADRDAALQAHLEQHQLAPSGGTWSSIPVRLEQQQPQPQQAEGAGQHVPSEQQQQAAAGSDSPAPPAAADSIPRPSSSQRVQRPVTPCSPGSRLSPRGSNEALAAAAAAAQLAAARLATSLRPPKTSSDFEAAWRSFRGDTHLQAKYLKLLEPAQLPAVFKSSLTAQLLTSILSAALPAAAAAAGTQAAAAAAAGGDDAGLDAAHAVALVQQLVQVPRFEMTVMCLTGKDKAALKQLWDAAAAAVSGDLQAQLQAARCKYRL